MDSWRNQEKDERKLGSETADIHSTPISYVPSQETPRPVFSDLGPVVTEDSSDYSLENGTQPA